MLGPASTVRRAPGSWEGGQAKPPQPLKRKGSEGQGIEGLKTYKKLSDNWKRNAYRARKQTLPWAATENVKAIDKTLTTHVPQKLETTKNAHRVVLLS